MADRITRVDDLDETSEASERITFGIRGQEYVIDLSEEHVREFDDALARFVTAARKAEPAPAVSAPRGRSRRQGSSAARDDIPQIRAWALSNGYDISERGRIKKEIIDAYDQAHG